MTTEQTKAQPETRPSEVRSDALSAAGDLLADYTGSCPNDLHDWEHPETCEKHCSDNAPSGCWVKYAQSIAANADHETRRGTSRSAPCSCSATDGSSQ
jgi:hypothetical protein